VCLIKTDPIRLVPKFLVYYIQSRTGFEQITGSMTGAAIKRIILQTIKASLIPLPRLSEQQRIVAILDEAFAGLATATANAEKNLKNARELFDGYLNSTFAQKGAGWIDRRLSNLVDVTHGYAFDGEYFIDGEGPHPILLTPGNFTELGSLNFNEKNTKRFTGTVAPNFALNAGDLVVVMTDLSSKMKILGKPAFVDRDDVLHNQRIGRVIFKEETLLPEYLYYFFRTAAFTSMVKDTATGTMVKHTAPKRILSAVVGVPPSLSEQQSIASALKYRAKEIEKLEAVYQNKLLALKKLKQSILQKAFSGALASRPSQATKEAAE
jgi:type I restriction enzyme S subunit